MREQRLFYINGQFQPITVPIARTILFKDAVYTKEELLDCRRWTWESIIAEAEEWLDILGIASMTSYTA